MLWGRYTSREESTGAFLSARASGSTLSQIRSCGTPARVWGATRPAMAGPPRGVALWCRRALAHCLDSQTQAASAATTPASATNWTLGGEVWQVSSDFRWRLSVIGRRATRRWCYAPPQTTHKHARFCQPLGEPMPPWTRLVALAGALRNGRDACARRTADERQDICPRGPPDWVDLGHPLSGDE